jgi:acyl carrier protein
MTHDQIAARVEGFVRKRFAVVGDDPGFSRRVGLFRDGYVDSLGVVELLAFIQDEFGVEVPDEALVPERFETIEDIARVVHGLL